ncbi:MAG TPA: hypothetical protein VFR11_18325 [Micromonosporaceae bacterium]|nr:hypothetical protein [Micromonosporaceae bacterium]
MIEARIEGARKLGEIGSAVRRAGHDRTILKHLERRIRGYLPELRTALRQSAADTLPHRGGFGRLVATKSSYRVSVRRGVSTAGVDVVISRKTPHGTAYLRALDDRGAVRHPLWGNRKHWYNQTVAPGFASRVVDGPAADEFTRQTLDAIDDTYREAFGGL